jgi:hypothetical protein
LEVNIPIEESDHTEPIRRVLVHHPVDTALVQPVGDPIDDIQDHHNFQGGPDYLYFYLYGGHPAF